MSFRLNATASRGFVLIEVLVAVGVAAALMAVLIRSFSQTWSGVNIVREEAEGTLLARSMMADAMLDRSKLVPGSQEGVAGRYAWKLTTAVVPVAVVAGKPGQKKQEQQRQQEQQTGARPLRDDNGDQSTSVLYHLVLVLKGPSGRSNRLDSYKIAQPRQ